MNSTQKAVSNAPLSQERYLSGPEFDGVRPILGIAVAKRCALLANPAQRELIWFLQGMSLQPAGVGGLARDILRMFPTRVCGKPKRAPTFSDPELRDLPLQDFLVEICVNPRLAVRTRREEQELNALEEERGGDGTSPRNAELAYFNDIVGALYEFKAHHEERIKAEFCSTEISRRIWGELDTALASRTMVLLNGLEGRGKTEAVRAWCKCHLGRARFVSLVGTSTKTEHFRELSRSLGVGHGASRKAMEMQNIVKEILQISGLMPVIDEAHFFFVQSTRISTRPEMLDWIDTALCNPPIPVALVTTPQFMRCMERAAIQAEWNYKQFRRRCKRTVVLPPKNTQVDILRVIRHLLPGADSATIKAVAGYEATSGRDLSAVGDVVCEAKNHAKEEGAPRVSYPHVKRAITTLFGSDRPWADMELRIEDARKGKKLRRPALTIDPGASSGRVEEPAQVSYPGRQTAPDREVQPVVDINEPSFTRRRCEEIPV